MKNTLITKTRWTVLLEHFLQTFLYEHFRYIMLNDTSTLQSPSISWIPFYRSLYYKTWHKLYLLIFLIQHDIPLYHNHRKCSMCMYAYWIMWLKGFLHHFCTIDGLFVNLECDILLLYRIILHCHIILKKYREKIIFKYNGIDTIIMS